ncbi:hypothetical protein DTO207G8_1796 [Paecilomyces variotii]|nr:hypothetical protein DTO207G8_1796 [Paecilomyces variotii]
MALDRATQTPASVLNGVECTPYGAIIAALLTSWRFDEIGKKLSVPVASKRRAASFTVYSNVVTSLLLLLTQSRAADSISSSRSPEVVCAIHPSSRADVVPGRFPGKLYLLEQFSHSLVPEHSELTMLYCGRTLAPALPN